MTDLDPDWEAAEDAWYNADHQRAIRVRLSGYMELCARRVERAGARLDASVTALTKARADADLALQILRRELAEAEEMARLIAIGDEEINWRLAETLATFEEADGTEGVAA